MNMTETNIRLAAIKLISRNGFEAMSLRQLAAEAGINSSTLYLYYKGKSELLLELILEYFQGMHLAWQRCRPARHGGADTLRAFIDCHVRFNLEHQEQAILGNLEFRSLEPGELDLVRQARRSYLRQLQDILEQGVRDGSLSCAEPKLMARTLFNMLTHACVWYQADGRWNIEQVIRHYCELVLKMLGALPLTLPRTRLANAPPPRAATLAEARP